jgi:cardiolipin synthase A/B
MAATTTGPYDMRNAVPSPMRLLLAVAALISALLVAQFVHRLLDATRGSPVATVRSTPPAEAAPRVSDARFLEVQAGLGSTSFAAGHTIEVLVSGPATFDRMAADLAAANRSITFQSYYCGAGPLADQLLDILRERARSGVRVHFLADGFGCGDLAAREGGTLRAAGVEVAVLRPVRWWTLHKAQHRSHVRVVVVDGAVSYTGGFGVDEKWVAADGDGWRDTNVRFTGPAVAQAQAAFIIAWAEATGELLASGRLLPGTAASATEAATAAGSTAALQFGGPGLGTTALERMLMLTVAGARERLYIASAYFVPGRPIRRELVRAAARGVDVRILTAGPRTDVLSTLFAARSSYDELLRAGIRIFEYEPTMMHAKTFVADGRWAAIGSMNMDNRSLRLNDETNLLVYDEAIGAWLERIFAADLASAREVTAEQRLRRPWSHRVLEAGARLVAPLL